MKRSKKYKEVIRKINNSTYYNVDEAIKLAKETSCTKFDSSIDLAMIFKLKEKDKKQSVRGNIIFPNNIGKEVKIAVIGELPEQKIAKSAGADFVGLDDIIKKIEEGWIDFDVLITHPKIMPKIAKLGRYIGKKGLMPNPKNGTVTNDIEKAVKSFKAGKTNFKMNEDGSFQMKIAKVSMDTQQIKDNLLAFVKAVLRELGGIKKENCKSIILSSTMGPSIKVDINSIFEQI